MSVMKKYAIDYDGHPLLSEEELLSTYTEECVLILDQVLMNKKTWSTVYQHMLDILKYGFNRYEIRHREIHFKIHMEDKTVYEMEIRHFYANLNLWYGFVEADAVDIMDETYIMDFHAFEYKQIVDYIDKKIFTLDIDTDTKGKIADEIMYNIAATSRAFEDIIGLGFSVYNLIQAANKYPVIDEILHEHIDTSLQPVEIEHVLSERVDVMLDALKKYPNDLRALLVSGKNISIGQLKEIVVRIGMKADIEGRIIPYVADCNLLVDGLKDAGSYYISAKSGRKSSIFSKLCMGVPGAFSKKVCINTTGIMLRKDYVMCDSVGSVPYEIKDKTYLSMLDKRYYYDDQDGDKMKLLDATKDTHLIGRTIKFRSPCTCTSENNTICKYCYGELYETNKDLTSAGCFAATKETEYLGQGILSTKHSQQTHSAAAQFSEGFDNDFEIASTEVVLKDSEDSDIDKYLIFDEVFKENDDEDELNYYVYGFKIVDAAHNLLYTVAENNGLKLYMSKGTHSLYMKYAGKRNNAIPLEEFEDIEDEGLFSIEIKSAESTEPTKLLKKLLNTKDHAGCKTLAEVCQRFADLKIQSGHPYNCVHAEMVIRGMLRKASNIYETPDFGPNGDPEDYQILRIDDSLYHNPSPFVSLTYGFVKKQITSPQFYKKSAPSQLDPLFAPTIGDIIVNP